MNAPLFNIRVYGIYFHKGRLLIAEQWYNGIFLRKLPGGGLHFGEGLMDCLKREYLEELNLEIEIEGHYYTTGFFVQSAFHKDSQVIAAYYLVKHGLNPDFDPSSLAIPVTPVQEGFQWLNFEDLREEDFSLPVDRYVIGMLKDDVKTGKIIL